MHNNDNLVRNPYVFGKPIYEYKNLFGRNDIIQRIKEHITKNDIKISLLHVQRRIGKTSLITCLPQFFTEEENGVKFVPFSFQGYKDNPIPEILNYLADEIAGTIQLPQKVRDMANGTRNFFELFLPKVIDQYLSGQKLVLLLDEFDVLEEKDKKGKVLFDYLKKAVKEQKKLFAILVFGRPLKDMKYLETFLQEEGQETIEVGLLNYEGTKDLIVKPVERIQSVFRYEQSAIDRIWELSAGHPSLTQLLCSNVFVHCRNKPQSVVRKDDVDSILSQAMGEGEAILQGFLEPLSNIEKSFFCKVAKGEKIEANLNSAGKRLEELGFVIEKDTGYEIKVKLVKEWLLKKHPSVSLDQEKRQMENNSKTNQNLTETNNKHKMPTQNGNNNSQGPNPIAKVRSLLTVVIILISLLGYSFFRIQNSRESKASRLECFRLLQDINLALGQPKERSRVIEETRNTWPRQEQSLDAQCPYAETKKLDEKYNKLLHLYGLNIIDIQEYEEAIIPLCEITEEYEESSEIKKIFVKWISTDGSWGREKIIEKLIEQNESENGCLIYSFKNQRDQDQLYEQRNQLYEQYAKDYTNNYEFKKAVESYCKISKEYDGFDEILEKLKGWLSDDPNLFPDERQKVEEKLQELNNQCPVSPLNNITN